ncbi:MAG: tRNA pseudouridine(55) synthase TruB [Bacteroidales bacterium]|nr:tRNA pseudouridine(55) synthase TruB [Bacteroidales bacterium]
MSEPLRVRPSQTLSHDVGDYPDGMVLAVNKPLRWSSADVIRKLKFAAIRHFGKKNLKVGHAGTLDPLAEGVLLVCIGAACKRAEEFQRHDKEYVADLVFGATTPSYDLEKEPDRFFPYEQIDRAKIEAILPKFLGEQMQVAPLFSAKSIDGVRAYELARKALRSGGPVKDGLLRESRIVIHELELLDFGKYEPPSGSADGADKNASTAENGSARNASFRIHLADASALKGHPLARLRIRCSKGTYIRALARDIGEALGSGAFLSRLIRTASGDFRLEEALSLQDALSLFERR